MSRKSSQAITGHIRATEIWLLVPPTAQIDTCTNDARLPCRYLPNILMHGSKQVSRGSGLIMSEPEETMRES